MRQGKSGSSLRSPEQKCNARRVLYWANGHFPTSILKALESSNMLRTLMITCYGFKPLHIDAGEGAKLRSMLPFNWDLSSLIFKNWITNYECAAWYPRDSDRRLYFNASIYWWISRVTLVFTMCVVSLNENDTFSEDWLLCCIQKSERRKKLLCVGKFVT